MKWRNADLPKYFFPWFCNIFDSCVILQPSGGYCILSIFWKISSPLLGFEELWHHNRKAQSKIVVRGIFHIARISFNLFSFLFYRESKISFFFSWFEAIPFQTSSRSCPILMMKHFLCKCSFCNYEIIIKWIPWISRA